MVLICEIVNSRCYFSCFNDPKARFLTNIFKLLSVIVKRKCERFFVKVEWMNLAFCVLVGQCIFLAADFRRMLEDIFSLVKCGCVI